MIAACPTDKRLQDFSLGRLNEEQSDLLFSHVSDCPDCQQRLDRPVNEDSLVGQLKSASAESDYTNESQCQTAMTKALAALAGVGEDAGATDRTKLPEKIGDYEVIRLIGRGGMGNVYLSKHAKLGRQVAVKVIASHRSHDPMMQGRFAKEMQAVGTLNHPNIVSALDAREVDGVAILVTEWIDGMNVSEIIHRLGPMKPADAAEVVYRVADALAAIDQAGLVHRDIKPSNIVISNTGEVKLLDLGLARLQGDGAGREFTMTGQAIGTVDYVAPEQIQGSEAIDIRTDLYGLGCTLFKMLTGSVPFDSPKYATSFAKMNAHVAADRPDLDRNDIPESLKKLTKQMMAADSKDRPSDTSEVIALTKDTGKESDLASLVRSAEQAQAPYAESQSKPVPSTAETTETLPWWRRRVTILTAIAAGMLGALIGFYCGVIITIKKPDGTTAQLNVPDNSVVTIDAQGNATVELAAKVASSNLRHRDPPGPMIDGPALDNPLIEPSNQPADPRFPPPLPTPNEPVNESPGEEFDPTNFRSGPENSSAKIDVSKLKGIWKMQMVGSRRGRKLGPNIIVFGDKRVAMLRDNKVMAVGQYTNNLPPSDKCNFGFDLAPPEGMHIPKGQTFWAPSSIYGHIKVIDKNNATFEPTHLPQSFHESQRSRLAVESFVFKRENVSGDYASYPSLAATSSRLQMAILLAYEFELDGQPHLPTPSDLELIQQVKAREKIRQLAIALHNFHDANKRFPASRIARPSTNVNGFARATDRKLHRYSWRVAILPYLGYQELHDQYRFDEPWDSFNNKKVLNQMPSVFRSPSAPKDAKKTAFLGVSGEHSAIGETQGNRLDNFKDGSSGTMLLIEANEQVPWTQPKDLVFDPDDPFQPKKEWFRARGAAVAFADASVFTMRTDALSQHESEGVNIQEISAFLTRNGGELARPSEYSSLFMGR